MRILFISAFYPPQVVGGWEQLVQDVNTRLQSRGHETLVLTSTHGVDGPEYSTAVHRTLTLESDLYHYQPRQFLGHKGRLKNNLTCVKETIEAFQPDVVFIHVMFNLSRGIAWQAEQLCPGRVVYYVANDWPHATDPHTAFWRDGANSPVMRLAKGLLAPIPLRMIAAENQRFALQFAHVLCVSHAVKRELATEAHIPLDNLSVVYNGVETDQFVPVESWLNRPSDRLALLYAGSLVAHKGVHTAVEALARLAQQNLLKGITLTLVGSGHPDYEARLKQQIAEANLADHVILAGRVPRAEMPDLLRKFDVLVFPSIWEEPLARMMQEGMAAGLVVIGTLTGGSGELLVEGETGLTFAPEDAAGLAQQIVRLRDEPELRIQLAQTGRDRVLAQFDIERMIDEIEAYLGNAIPHSLIDENEALE